MQIFPFKYKVIKFQTSVQTPELHAEEYMYTWTIVPNSYNDDMKAYGTHFILANYYFGRIFGKFMYLVPV